MGPLDFMTMKGRKALTIIQGLLYKETLRTAEIVGAYLGLVLSNRTSTICTLPDLSLKHKTNNSISMKIRVEIKGQLHKEQQQEELQKSGVEQFHV